MTSIPAGSSRYAFPDPRPGPARTITVHTHRPASFTADSPILMVMHGRARNGDEYRDFFVADSERRGFLVVAPTFDEAQYANPWAYNYGEMCDAEGRMLPRERWLFPVLGKVFEDARSRAGSTRETFSIFGHSAGSQLVHRLATFSWIDAIDKMVAANAGSYTLPVRGEAFPFGLGGTQASDDDLRKLFARPIIVQLGDKDVLTTEDNLPREPGAMKQGPYRFARGQNYFEVAKREAARLGVPLAWQLEVVPGIAHSGQGMAPFAARALFG